MRKVPMFQSRLADKTEQNLFPVNFCNRNMGFGLSREVLVGSGASSTSGVGLGLSMWGALLARGTGWLAPSASITRLIRSVAQLHGEPT